MTIEIRGFTEDDIINLPAVARCDTMTEALSTLESALLSTSATTGGQIATDWEGNSITWLGGPPDWASAYAVGCGATNRVFTCFAEPDGTTLVLDKLH